MSKHIGSINKDQHVYIAEKDDMKGIVRLLKGVSSWLQESRLKQWEFLNEGGEDPEIKQAIEDENTFIVKEGDELIATFTLYEIQNPWDKNIWGQSSDDAFYLHRLSVDYARLGTGLGRDVIAWMETYTKTQGMKRIRLDCVENNEKLNSIYQNLGYDYKGTNHEHCRYEKML
ncbi:GNAT family N-acetyltransferase [Oceanobacillus iheyensis]|uniref:Hypothetical conserved protein n=1 Tax=Oceanobacillus iheyensis (strain DSM 14371 / CIP 107618 / JCM 11309 / KCTC 3954 / HTE831) TaxID=221109 RepID=Q8ET98_OCEIH|nr:GNAT family N-acetyltransferase [Oceanobacillus iheyensis]BAC12319.1 hypothetical conserved protein [Oceanobacillus iheyensis HTE831]